MAEENGELSAGYRGFSIRLKSQQLLWLVMILGLFVLIFAGGRMLAEEVRIVRNDHQRILLDQNVLRLTIIEQFDAILFLLSLPEGQRPSLRMPRVLRERLEAESESSN